MKHLFFAFLVCLTLSSCYAFLKADKLVYAGTIAKKPVQVNVDTAYNTSVVVDDVQFSE